MRREREGGLVCMMWEIFVRTHQRFEFTVDVRGAKMRVAGVDARWFKALWAVMEGWRLDRMFPNLPPLRFSLQFGGFSVITGMLRRFGFWKQIKNTNITVACCMWRPDFVAIKHFLPRTKETEQQQGLCRCQAERNVRLLCQGLQALFWLLQLCLSSCSLCHVCFPFFFFLFWLSCKSITGQDFLGD